MYNAILPSSTLRNLFDNITIVVHNQHNFLRIIQRACALKLQLPLTINRVISAGSLRSPVTKITIIVDDKQSILLTGTITL